MLFTISYRIMPGTRDTAQARFKTTGGLPPEGVKMLGRWHNVDGSGGCVLAETASALHLGVWLQEWTDILQFDARPVATDEEMLKVIGG